MILTPIEKNLYDVVFYDSKKGKTDLIGEHEHRLLSIPYRTNEGVEDVIQFVKIFPNDKQDSSITKTETDSEVASWFRRML